MDTGQKHRAMLLVFFWERNSAHRWILIAREPGLFKLAKSLPHTRFEKIELPIILDSSVKPSQIPWTWASNVIPRYSIFLENEIGPTDESKWPGLLKFCKILATPSAPVRRKIELPIILAIRSEASGQRPNGQTENVEKNGAHGVARFLQNFCRPGRSESSLGPKPFCKKVGAPRCGNTGPCPSNLRGFYGTAQNEG